MATAIITGAASGIGEALADKLVARGDTVYVADIDADGAAEVADRLGSRAIARKLDVTDAAAVQALVDEVDAEHGLDLMVNNAGIAVGGEFTEFGLEHWNRTIDVNLRGVIHGVHAAYPKMKARGRGQILNTASLAGLVSSPLSGPYSATKHAVVALSLSLRPEAALHGVRVSVLCPGVIDTPIFERANDGLPQTAAGANARSLFHQMATLLQGGKFYPPERLAADAVRGLETNAPVIVAPLGARLLWWLDRTSPSRVRDIISRLGFRRIKQRLGV
jgi:NAD(P)-dependent dehydrogenase (short-subunit alcohol dehydrogenase family)